MTPQTYRRKATDVEAFRFIEYHNGHTSGEEVALWCDGTYHALGHRGVARYSVTVPVGPHMETASPGDYVVKDADGSFSVVSAQDFDDRFEVSS